MTPNQYQTWLLHTTHLFISIMWNSEWAAVIHIFLFLSVVESHVRHMLFMCWMLRMLRSEQHRFVFVFGWVRQREKGEERAQRSRYVTDTMQVKVPGARGRQDFMGFFFLGSSKPPWEAQMAHASYKSETMAIKVINQQHFAKINCRK